MNFRSSLYHSTGNSTNNTGNNTTNRGDTNRGSTSINSHSTSSISHFTPATSCRIEYETHRQSLEHPPSPSLPTPLTNFSTSFTMPVPNAPSPVLTSRHASVSSTSAPRPIPLPLAAHHPHLHQLHHSADPLPSSSLVHTHGQAWSMSRQSESPEVTTSFAAHRQQRIIAQPPLSAQHLLHDRPTRRPQPLSPRPRHEDTLPRSSLSPRSPRSPSHAVSVRGTSPSSPTVQRARSAPYAPPSRATDRLPPLIERLRESIEASRRTRVSTTTMPQPTTITTHARPASDAALMTHSLASATEVVSEPTMTPLSPPSPSVSGLFLSSSSNTEWTDEMLRLLCGSPAVGPNVFGIPCSTAAQRAYSKYSLETQQGFKRLQTQDSGTVEHRTIAFSTHLTISRWEPVAPAATPLSKTQSTIGPENTSEMTTEPQDNAPSQVAGRKHIQGSPRIKQEASSPKSDPVLAARLMSLANYIRHIVSLTSGNSPVHTASELVYRRLQQLQQQQQQQREHKLRATLSPQPRESLQPVDQSRAPCETAAATALPSPLSARPGPIRSSDLTKRYRGQSEYADHRTRRLQYHSQQQSQQSSSDLHAAMPSPISPLVNLKKAGRTFSVVSGAEKKPSLSPLLKTPFPNITLTLALIYVDRLKAKYPEAKGEQGCSHRLFLVAYIIAAKYRCTVELASLMRECEHVLRRQFRDGTDNDNEQDEQDVYNAPSRDYEDLDQTTGDRSNGLENPLKAALKQHRRKEGRDAIQELKDALARAEVVFSNYEWVRLLSLGSFFRPPAPPASTPTLTQPVTTASNKSMYASDPTLVAVKTEEDDSITRPLKPSAKSLPINASPRAREEDSDQNDCGFKKLKVDTSAFRAMTAPAMATPLTASAMTSGLLQVEDLDRMEAEFLTFLDFDLCSRSQDLDTCWSLLVGNKN